MNLVYRNRFPATKLGGQWFSSENWINQWVEMKLTAPAKELRG